MEILERDMCASPFGYQSVEAVDLKEVAFPQKLILGKEKAGSCASQRENLSSKTGPLSPESLDYFSGDWSPDGDVCDHIVVFFSF